MEVELTKQEYAEARDAFARVAGAIEDLQGFAFQTLSTPDSTSVLGVADHLDEDGYYMTGDDYISVEEARQLFARLAGLNAARAV